MLRRRPSPRPAAGDNAATPAESAPGNALRLQKGREVLLGFVDLFRGMAQSGAIDELAMGQSLDALEARAARELAELVREVEGSDREVDPLGGVAEVGAALAEELVSLHMLLDGSGDRARVRERYMK